MVVEKKIYIYTELESCKVGDQNNVSFHLLLIPIWKDLLKTWLPSIFFIYSVKYHKQRRNIQETFEGVLINNTVWDYW